VFLYEYYSFIVRVLIVGFCLDSVGQLSSSIAFLTAVPPSEIVSLGQRGTVGNFSCDSYVSFQYLIHVCPTLNLEEGGTAWDIDTSLGFV